jgi:predicted RecA/RadA family phage recombinase
MAGHPAVINLNACATAPWYKWDKTMNVCDENAVVAVAIVAIAAAAAAHHADVVSVHSMLCEEAPTGREGGGHGDVAQDGVFAVGGRVSVQHIKGQVYASHMLSTIWRCCSSASSAASLLHALATPNSVTERMQRQERAHSAAANCASDKYGG